MTVKCMWFLKSTAIESNGICLSRHLKGTRKSRDLGKQKINMHRPTLGLPYLMRQNSKHSRSIFYVLEAGLAEL